MIPFSVKLLYTALQKKVHHVSAAAAAVAAIKSCGNQLCFYKVIIRVKRVMGSFIIALYSTNVVKIRYLEFILTLRQELLCFPRV